ncbi:putative enoyl-CoA hydratase echA6 [Rhodobacteraceae bacterium THAF1]|uniref:enoyl-CoA hydratase/isomerase family protein n=1 Tax=Palleronia sp. THAF1 TaxID=2587842 RepID=UPI000F3FD5D2|nr:enoyl-CoA hydratase/isomerase family protein [Palleronia sp. THAF1]QFU10024.1 putative enoyl-CoA hydratase echA6 [Palleronia sp. THAF1]VDC17071.1 putative enoyl-CoA hydratase echA6 [Rhodobacteraceae bacterium THAF1]
MTVRIEDDGALRRVVLDRSAKANALTAEMLEAVRDAAACDARVLVLTGAGSVFSAGADLEAARAGLAVSPLWKEVSDAVAGFAGLTIAALNGPCAGGAMGMMLACDLRIAVPGARFFYPVMKLGYLPQPDDPGRLVALVGPARAKLILMGAVKIGAEEALAMGLVDRIVDDLDGAVAEVSEAALAAKDGHAAAIKRMV